ncbi:MAG: hypothetical protein ACFFDH_12805 [Promethearchaeota archaeon]
MDIKIMRSKLLQVAKKLQKANNFSYEYADWIDHAEKAIGISKKNAMEKAEKCLLKIATILAEINRLSK